MKARVKILVPFTLGLLVSACSTPSQQQTDTVIVSEPDKTEESALNEENTVLREGIASKDTTINSLEQQLVDRNKQITLLNQTLLQKEAIIDSLEQRLLENNAQITSLNNTLDEKDAQIAILKASATSAEDLAELEEQRRLRSDLESQYAVLKLDNDLLARRINQLENENRSLKQHVSSLENAPTSEDGFQKSYYVLLSQNTALQEKYANLETDNKLNQQQLSVLKKENRLLSEALSDARAQLSDTKTQLSEQKSISLAYKLKTQDNILQLEAALNESASYQSLWKELDNKLALAQQQNASLTSQLSAAEAKLAVNQTELNDLLLRLNGTQKELDQQKNDGISIAATIEALQSQMRSNIQNVRWQLPSEMALHDTFEILVTANVQTPLAGQVYQAELVTDSAIQMISGRVANAIVQNGQLQWRWRIAGLNERPDAQLGLFVSQQINVQEQTIMRQVYRGNETLSLVNTNLFEKYGYWSGAILLGLFGGFLIGRLNNRKKNEL